MNGEGHLISSCGTTAGAADAEGGGDAYNAISANGETVFFTAVGHNVSGCEESIAAPEVNELYARLDQVQTVAISEPSPGQCSVCNVPASVAEGRRPAVFQGASEDGSKVFFLTEQELFAGDLKKNLYEYDFDAPVGERVVRVSTGSAAPEVQGVARVSEDGSHVYFVAKEVLTGANGEGHSPTATDDNLYVFERDAAYPTGRLAFVATLSGSDSKDWSQSDYRPVQATPEGRFLVFDSVAGLTPGDTSSVSQVFEYDALREKLVLVSIGAAGNVNASPSSIPEQGSTDTSAPTTTSTRLAVSADGSRVLFQSQGALTEGAEVVAAAGAQSVYEYHSTGAIENGDVYLISDGMGTLASEMLGLDASGDDAFFSTADALVPADEDTGKDFYDARVGGGFSPPAASAACEAEACQGSPSVAPSLAQLGAYR